MADLGCFTLITARFSIVLPKNFIVTRMRNDMWEIAISNGCTPEGRVVVAIINGGGSGTLPFYHSVTTLMGYDFLSRNVNDTSCEVVVYSVGDSSDTPLFVVQFNYCEDSKKECSACMFVNGEVQSGARAVTGSQCCLFHAGELGWFRMTSNSLVHQPMWQPKEGFNQSAPQSSSTLQRFYVEHFRK